jgi:hypothetical protein
MVAPVALPTVTFHTLWIAADLAGEEKRAMMMRNVREWKNMLFAQDDGGRISAA